VLYRADSALFSIFRPLNAGDNVCLLAQDICEIRQTSIRQTEKHFALCINLHRLEASWCRTRPILFFSGIVFKFLPLQSLSFRPYYQKNPDLHELCFNDKHLFSHRVDSYYDPGECLLKSVFILFLLRFRSTQLVRYQLYSIIIPSPFIFNFCTLVIDMIFLLQNGTDYYDNFPGSCYYSTTNLKLSRLYGPDPEFVFNAIFNFISFLPLLNRLKTSSVRLKV